MKLETDRFVCEMNHWHTQTLGHKTVEALKRNRFDAEFFDKPEDAVKKILEFIKPGSRVAFGGSQTARQLDLVNKVTEAGGMVLDHNAIGLTDGEKLEVMRQQQVCDVFICSSNAISLQGELFNIDGHGNRISAMVFGPKKVIVIAGVNKICSDEAASWDRIHTIAAPVNMKRLNRPNPCTTAGVCKDCNLISRGCNAYLVLRKKPSLTDFSVYIVNSELGF